MQRTFQQWIATKWQGIDQDNLRMKFSPLNVDFSSSSPDPLDSRRPAQAGVRQFPLPLKSRPSYFTAIISCSVKTVPDEHRHAACHNKQQWQAFCWCQHRWPWMTLNPVNGGFSEFFAISGCGTHFTRELRRNGWRWTWTTCVWHFSIERAFLII